MLTDLRDIFNKLPENFRKNVDEEGSLGPHLPELTEYFSPGFGGFGRSVDILFSETTEIR